MPCSKKKKKKKKKGKEYSGQHTKSNAENAVRSTVEGGKLPWSGSV
jgi:hypothetical protein